MTPSHLASHLVGLLNLQDEPASVLDPGAGEGALSAAVVAAWRSLGEPAISLTAIEIDPGLADKWEHNVVATDLDVRLVRTDFVGWAVAQVGRESFSHVVMNPPYVRLTAGSEQWNTLRQRGTSHTNLYSAFIGLGVELLSPGGVLVALVPRSFCNGPYFSSLRRQIRREASVEEIQVFERRDHLFERDGVLQENVVLRLRKGAEQGDVRITHYSDGTLTRHESRRIGREEFFASSDDSAPFRIPDPRATVVPLGRTLEELGYQVFTGSVVDFRVRDWLRHSLERDCVPLVHAHHVGEKSLDWPKLDPGRMNALCVAPATQGHVHPPGVYVVIRRFSYKEQRRRLVAAVVDATRPAYSRGVAFENHVNVISGDTNSLSLESATELVQMLHAPEVDSQLRALLGSTQVNVSDLRMLKLQ